MDNPVGELDTLQDNGRVESAMIAGPPSVIGACLAWALRAVLRPGLGDLLLRLNVDLGMDRRRLHGPMPQLVTNAPEPHALAQELARGSVSEG